MSGRGRKEDPLEDDPDLKALKPPTSRLAIINAAIFGALTGLAIAVWGWQVGRTPPEDREVPPPTPSLELDAPEPVGTSPWLATEEPAAPGAQEPSAQEPGAQEPQDREPATGREPVELDEEPPSDPSAGDPSAE